MLNACQKCKIIFLPQHPEFEEQSPICSVRWSFTDWRNNSIFRGLVFSTQCGICHPTNHVSIFLDKYVFHGADRWAALLCLNFTWLSRILSIFSYRARKSSFVLCALWVASDNLSLCPVLKLLPNPSAFWPKSPSMLLLQQQLPLGIPSCWWLPTPWWFPLPFCVCCLFLALMHFPWMIYVPVQHIFQ